MTTTDQQVRPIVAAILKEYEKAKHRNWDRWYWTVDIHETMTEPNYDKENITKRFYEGAIACLQKISARKDVRLILDTSTPPRDIEKYLSMFNELDIRFRYVNSNPEEKSSEYADFDGKFYFNVRLEDKAGFEPEKDWRAISDILDELPELTGPVQTFDVTATVVRIHSPSGPHEGHEKLFKQMFERGKNVIIFLACDHSFPSKKNPLSFEDRRFMIERSLANMGYANRAVSIAALPNQRKNAPWAANLDRMIRTLTQNPHIETNQVALFHSRDGFGRHYTPHGRFSVIYVPEVANISATKIREEAARTRAISIGHMEGKVLQQERMPVLTLIQVRAIIKNRHGDVLMVKYDEPNDMGYRFPGGYFAPNKDKDLVACLKRKMEEKFVGVNSMSPVIVGTTAVEDWRHGENGASVQAVVYRCPVQTTQILLNPEYHIVPIRQLSWIRRHTFNDPDFKDRIDPEDLPIMQFID